MISGINSAQPLKRPEELKARSLQALQQQQAARQQQSAPESQELHPNEKVSLSKELSEDVNGAYQQDHHQGLEALLANMMAAQEPKKIEAVQPIKEVGKGEEVGKVGEATRKPKEVHKQQAPELKEDDKKAIEKSKDPKASERLGNLKVSSKKDSQGVKDRPQLPSSEQVQNHQKPGSKGAPKTDAPRPVGATEQMKSSKPDGKVGLRQLPQMRNGRGGDGLDLSEEMKELKQSAVA
ncbi:hypothetical protein JST97_29345 [bacterium]|nr:hypothetical protein [bacterium]